MENRTIRMSLVEHRRALVIEGLLAGRVSEVDAACRLNLSTRQVRRLKRRVREDGSQGVIHRLRGRFSPRRTPDAVVVEVRELYDRLYGGWNMEHLGDRLKKAHGIILSREKLRQILIDHPLRPRRRKRRRHRRWRPRRDCEGELVQMDASIHPWLGKEGQKAVLISAVDDATGKVLCAEFFESAGTLANLALVKQMVRKYGIPESLYLDRATEYFPGDAAELEARERGEKAVTQFGRAMAELGTGMIKARSPQAKGRVERSFRTFQDRLVKELSLEGIKTRKEANHYLKSVFLPAYNRKFAGKAESKERSFVKVGRGFEYSRIFCVKEKRAVRNDYTISYKGERIQLEETSLRAGQKVEVRVWLDGSIHVYRKNKEINAQNVKALQKAC